MATPRVGADGHRRLTVTITLQDDEADLLWTVAYLRSGNAAAGCSQIAKAVLREHLRTAAKDPQVQAMGAVLAAARPTPGRRLRLVPDPSSTELDNGGLVG